jgi:hypothetical protein
MIITIEFDQQEDDPVVTFDVSKGDEIEIRSKYTREGWDSLSCVYILDTETKTWDQERVTYNQDFD